MSETAYAFAPSAEKLPPDTLRLTTPFGTLGSFVMAKAIAACIQAKRPERVTLVAMGERAERPAPEDKACADYLEHLLTGKPYDPVGDFQEVVFQPTAQKFISGVRDYLPWEDPIFCLQRDLQSCHDSEDRRRPARGP